MTSIKVPGPVWFDQTDASPSITIENTTFAELKFVTQPGVSDIGDTLVLSAAYALGWPYTELYGNQLPTPIVVVAISASTGQAYLANLEVVYEFETDMGLVVAVQDQDINQGGPSQNLRAVGGYFNVDLGAQLALPPEAGYYQVFLWLDDIVTPVQTVQIPANSARTGGGPDGYEVGGTGLVSVRSTSQSPPPTPKEIRTDLDTQSSSLRVYGTLPQGTLQSPPTGGASGDPVLTILAANRQAQSFAWHAATSAWGTMVSTNTPNFDFDPFQLIARPDPAANVFVVTVLGNLNNQVLPVLADYQG